MLWYHSRTERNAPLYTDPSSYPLSLKPGARVRGPLLLGGSLADPFFSQKCSETEDQGSATPADWLIVTLEQGFEHLGKYAAYYAATPGMQWKLLPVHGIAADGRCTCGKPHTDPKDIGKHPALNNWQNDASSDPTMVEGWWSTDPRYNIAVMAQASGFLVVDIDPRSGGFESLDIFETRYPNALTPTVEAMTGAYKHNGKTVRGRHMYYRVDEAENLVGNLKAMGLPGIDIKHRGYTLIAPSNHLSGVAYEWVDGKAPWQIQMADANDELLGALRKGRRRGSSVSTGGTDWDYVNDLEWGGNKLDIDRFLNEGIDEGSRAVDIYAMACALANKMPTVDEKTPDGRMYRQNIETQMIRFNHEMVRPPLELEGTNSLMMHVRRALDFVAENPKTKLFGSMGEGAVTWMQNRTTTAPAEPVRTTEMRPATEYANYVQEVMTSDPDDWDDDDNPWVETNLAGTIGGQVHNIAYQGGSIHRRSLDVPKDPDALSPEEGGDPNARSLSDLGNGRRFVDTFQPVVRYSPGLGWFNWTGKFWKPDVENLSTRELSKRLPAIISAEVSNYEDTEQQTKVVKWADQTKSNARQNSALESATSDPRVLVDVEGWDSNPYLFGCQNGVINLKTGELLRGRPDLYITRRGPVAYTPGLSNPRWKEFLDYATGGDQEYQDWLQRAAGYTLTGLRTHDVMFLVYGPGGSGKNVFVEALVKAMGSKDYAWPMDSQILAQGDGAAHGSDLYHWAELRGRRMAWVDELPESERLKENSVKKLTGSNEISARSPGEKPFTFNSQAKLWVTTNHRPIITDDAMWRRIRPIPWLNKPTTPDPTLKDYIFDPEGGLPGVLAWAVEGAIKLLNSTESDSLGWCKVVQDAAEVYRKNEDRMGKFLSEETVEEPGKSLPVDILFTAYEGWSSRRSEKPMTRIAFDRKLMDRNIKIDGEGRRAVIVDRDLTPAESLPDAGNSGWDMMSAMHNR